MVAKRSQCSILNASRRFVVTACAMALEGTPGKWSLWATHPERLGGVEELYDTAAEAAARVADLRGTGYTVEITPLASDCPMTRAFDLSEQAAACRELADHGRRQVAKLKDAKDKKRLLQFIYELEDQATDLDKQASGVLPA
jgi:hypothetical protein